MTEPLVSCLCVSRPVRWGQLQRAIADFDRQTYPNRELIVVVDQKTDYAGLIDSYVHQELEHPLKAPIKIFARPAHSQLDGLVYAMCQARGDYITFWDDDNQNHPTRLEVQVDKQKRFPDALTALGEALYFFHGSHELFVVSYAKPDASAAERCAASTLMGPRDYFPALEPQWRARPSEMLVNSAARTGKKLVIVSGLPHLHMVGVTFDNLRGYDTHRQLAQDRCRLAAWLEKNKDALIKAFDDYKWDYAKVEVQGNDALAFTYETKQHWPDSLFPIKVKDDTVEEVTEYIPEKK